VAISTSGPRAFLQRRDPFVNVVAKAVRAWPSSVVLVGRLSNHDLSTLLQSLTMRTWRQGSGPRRSGGVAPDGRRKCGSVGDAVIQVLQEAGTDLRLADIHKRVGLLLGSPVARSSVKSYLARDDHRQTPLFERVSRGRYALRQK